ncbi:AMP-dependent synthetase [Planococcus lenghuensis]|uniref:AMP-dependent synthetase n=1 Tax=Planococcus lenghuensis TaxID=2213202 RepID=A0A1Q2L3D6_9BACL|nr:AMP-dependent synthetase [Planococcus lenghuensis]
MLKLVIVLYRMQLLSFRGLTAVLSTVQKHGVNLMTLLEIREKYNGQDTALVDDNGSVSYSELLAQSSCWATSLRETYGLRAGQKAGVLCRNHIPLVGSLIAVSRLGADCYLLNPEIGREQFSSLTSIHDFDLLICDADLTGLVEGSESGLRKVCILHPDKPVTSRQKATSLGKEWQVSRSSAGRLILLTGGTTGAPKEAPHKPSLFKFLNPFLAVLIRLNFLNLKTIHIATPLYHGYGLAILLVCLALGKKAVLSSRFDAHRTCSLIRKHHVEAVTVVPLMLQKMLRANTDDLQSLCCIASGGAALSPQLVLETEHALGPVLYNLYGTSEAGLNLIATPEDLKAAPATNGRQITGMQLKIIDANKKPVPDGMIGHICVKSGWSMNNRKRDWIETGDLGYRSKEGYYFLCGRIDDMIVSGGENVYPVEVERVLSQHPLIEDVAVIGVDDDRFGQRLRAFVQTAEGTELTEEVLADWLGERIARYQMPREIRFVKRLPYTSLGKLNKKRLQS